MASIWTLNDFPSADQARDFSQCVTSANGQVVGIVYGQLNIEREGKRWFVFALFHEQFQADEAARIWASPSVCTLCKGTGQVSGGRGSTTPCSCLDPCPSDASSDTLHLQRASPETFSIGEVEAIREMVLHLAHITGEDVMGAIMKTSGHRFLDDAGVVALAKKLGSATSDLKG